MIDREKVVCAIENCIGQPKCKDCPWEDCEVEHEVVNHVPYGLLRDALALLKEQETMRWISVKDRLPERNGFYLAYDRKYIGSVEYEKGRADSEWTDDYEGYLDLNVTHWMPLPEAPKEEG